LRVFKHNLKMRDIVVIILNDEVVNMIYDPELKDRYLAMITHYIVLIHILALHKLQMNRVYAYALF
jgi:multisubunit Na+/H+ antiporter MnhF subunit